MGKLIEVMMIIIVVAINACVLIGCAWLSVYMFNSLKRKLDKPKKSGPITAILYDSKVEQVVDMVYIKGVTSVIWLPVLEEPKLEPVYEVHYNRLEGPKTKRYDFFCIQDDGKHIFIERC